MAEINANWLWLCAVVVLLAFFVGANAFPKEVEVKAECDVCPEIPECKPETVYQNVTEEIQPLTYKSLALEEFLDHLDDEELYACGGNEYSEDETEVVKTYDEFSVEFNEDEYTVDFSARLKYKESDLRSCRESYDVSVYYEEGEDPEVTFAVL